MNNFTLHQVVTSPTHFSHCGSPSIIDLSFLSHPHHLKLCTTIPSLANSDHMGLSIEYLLPTSTKRPQTARRTVWCYARGDFKKACELLQQTDWDSIFADENVHKCWKRWHTVFMEVMHQCIPRRALPSRKNLPWINHSIIITMRRRNILYKKYKSTGSP